ncbi:hypothetical protein LEP1GSC168_3608 [Leptospira santarosai str. HAI134]|nr:hypothetical protein LEP1GSC168_3608 [Leptospira santarosai str. HAI134]
MGGSKFGICRATFITLLSSKQNSEPTLKTRSFFYDFVFLQFSFGNLLFALFAILSQ